MSSTVAPKAPSPGKHEHLFEATGVLPRQPQPVFQPRNQGGKRELDKPNEDMT